VPRGWSMGKGVLSPLGRGLGRGCAPTQKFLKIYIPNGIFDALWRIVLRLCWQH